MYFPFINSSDAAFILFSILQLFFNSIEMVSRQSQNNLHIIL